MSELPTAKARWLQGPILLNEVEELAKLLASEGGYTYTHDVAQQMTDLAINNLRTASPEGEAGEALLDLANKLLRREA